MHYAARQWHVPEFLRGWLAISAFILLSILSYSGDGWGQIGNSAATVEGSPAGDIPLTTRLHMDAATQAVYDRIRSRQSWLLGVDALGTAANPFVTVAAAQVQSRWTELYGAETGMPACIEWEMGERNGAAAHRDWSGLTAFAASGGLPWIMASLKNFTVPFVAGTPPQGGMNDTRNRAAGVLPGGSGNAAFTAYIRQLAREIKAVERPVVFRPFHEGNGGWFWWGGNAADFKELWNITFQVFQAEGVRNVIWLWAASDVCSGASCNAAAFYPGDSVVDMLGVDLYFTGPSLPASAVNTLAVLEAIGTDKPIVIGELGPAARADFWGQAVSAFANIKRFRGFSLWFARGWKAWGGTPGVGSLIDGSTDAATREAFAAFLADPHIMTLARWSDVLPDKLYFPHIDTNLPWQTEIAVINTGDQTVSGTLVGVSNTGQTVNTRSFTLPAHGRRQINVAEEFANHASIGYIVFNSDSTAVQGYTKFYQSGVYRAAVPAVKEVNTSDIFIPHIDSSALWWTGVSLLNTTATPKNLTITFNTGQNSQVSLAPNEHKAFTIASLFQGQPQPDIKSAVISNAGGVIGLELFGNNGGGSQLDGILLTGNTASTLLYPHVASDTAWWTGIVAYNPAAFPCTITITPYSDQGAPLLSSTLSIAGKEKYVGLVSGLGLPPGTAWLKIDSTRPLAGFELFATWDGKQLAAYAGGGLGGKAGIFPKIEKNGWTGIAFVNTEAGDASVMLTAYNDNGNVVATWALALGGHAKVVNFAEAIFSQDLSAATYIAYSSDRNVVGFQLNGSADGMLLDGLPGLGVGDDPVSD